MRGYCLSILNSQENSFYAYKRKTFICSREHCVAYNNYSWGVILDVNTQEGFYKVSWENGLKARPPLCMDTISWGNENYVSLSPVQRVLL